MSKHSRRALESHSTLTKACFGVAHSISSCFKRREPASSPQNQSHRRIKSDLDINGSFDLDLEGDKAQYTLKSVRRYHPTCLWKFLRCYWLPCCTVPSYVQDSPTMDINTLISAYLSFSHRTSYFLLFLLFSLFYFGFILVFAIIYYAGSLYYPECITSAGMEIGEGEGATMFGDSFQLSWTTFSTVG